MSEKVQVEVVTPARLLLEVEADMVVVPGGDGDFGVLPGHAPLMSTVRPGIIDIYDGDKISNRIFVAGGFADVSGERCAVLAEEAVPAADIDKAAAEERLSTAQAAFDAIEEDSTERAAAELAVKAAEAMVEAAG